MPRTSVLALPPVLLLLYGCSGGTSAGVPTGLSCSGHDRNVLCLENCSLGCSSTGCQVTEIAQNENIVLRFSTEVDPHSVDNSSIQFRTAAGLEPVGEFLVNGAVVEFVPQVLVVGGQSFFGFRGGETYSMTLPGGVGEPNAVRSTSGDPLKATLSCALHVSRGIVDLNGAPPKARLVSPAATRDVPRDAVIQLEFNELLDITPFLGSSGSTSPVVFSVRHTHEVNGRRECRPLGEPRVLAGAPDIVLVPSRNVTVVTFQPSTPLPGSSCVEITVTERVRDLAQVAAEPQLFQYITEAAVLVEDEIVEDFVSDLNLDRDASSGTWGNGRGQFGAIGGDGRHGRFDLSLGVLSPLTGAQNTLCTINTDNTIIPARNTTTGAPIAVTDGRFFFDEMVVPSNVKVRFVGNAAPQISVRGRLELQGAIDVEGDDRPLFDAASSTTSLVAGQTGGAGGAFGGNGGQGGDQCPGTTLATAVNTGRNGQDCRVPGGHAFAGSVAGTGGRGSLVFPLNGLNTSLIFPAAVTFAFSAQAGPGGGGGGLFTPGGNGRVVSNNMPEPLGSLLGTPGLPPRRDFMGPNSLLPVTSSAFVAPPAVLKIQNAAANPTATAIAYSAASATGIHVGEVTGTWATNDPVFAVLASGNLQVSTVTGNVTALFSGKSLPVLPVPAGSKSSTHFLIGGSGGGGGGSHSAFALGGVSVPSVRWAAGAGGGGGGGAISLRAGHLLQIASAARILASGGSCGVSPQTPAPAAQACPGGGGSGGSVLLQGGSTVDVRGLIDVSGGSRGRLSRQAQQAPPAGATINTEGGDGSRGFVRVEGPTPVQFRELNLLPPATPDNVGVLTELDDRSGFRSLWRSTGQPFGPEFVRYEIRALVDGQPVLFSDDASVGPPARAGVAPIDALFQAATIDLVTQQVDPDSIRDWRQTVGSFGAGASIADDALNAVRFQIVIDRTFGQTVEIVGVRIVFRV